MLNDLKLVAYFVNWNYQYFEQANGAESNYSGRVYLKKDVKKFLIALRNEMNDALESHFSGDCFAAVKSQDECRCFEGVRKNFLRAIKQR